MSESDTVVYNAKNDPQFQKPYIDVDEWREGAVRYRYIHGGFEGTETRFSFYFPTREQYKGRFFHFMSPMQGSENASQVLEGEEDKIAFAITHGAYFVETNMGVGPVFGPLADPTIIYRASAAAAEYSREVAAKLFGEHRPFGYIYGGSGGGFKSTSCLENGNAWDGVAPYVIGSPAAIPNCFTVRVHAKRALRRKLHLIADAVDAGGGDMYAGLDGEEREALEEVTKMGFPPRSWFCYKTLDDGALPVLTWAVNDMDPSYYEDFWKAPGYLGADPNSSAARDRVQHTTKVIAVHLPRRIREAPENMDKTGVDDSWQRLARGDTGLDSKPYIEVENLPETDYLAGLVFSVASGEAAGFKTTVDGIEGNRLLPGAFFGQDELLEALAKVKAGDEILLDNSDYIALQTFHRHQYPGAGYAGWEQFIDKEGKPRYPQRPFQVGPIVAQGGAGSLQSGKFKGKMIVVAAMMDMDALPWQPDWYRQRVKEHLGEKEQEQFRLWYIDRALHGDISKTLGDLHVVNYLGALHQALLDLAAWVERGVAPPETTSYTVSGGQLSVPPAAKERRGIQPVIQLKANGAEKAEANVGQPVSFSASVEVPPGAGRLIAAEWSFEGETDYPVKGIFTDLSEDGASATVLAVHRFYKSGVYFPVLRVTSNRIGDAGDIFTRVKNLSRVRVVVEEALGPKPVVPEKGYSPV
ncbi:MAG: hypothetical protein LBD79_06075 [Treponema sp.]|jgi:hypothetical protein|nr:hypothetical protein [Treponema sp.]